MSRKKRETRAKKPGLESWVKWQLNEFRKFPVPHDPWTDETAKEFYAKNHEAIHLKAKKEGREDLLQEWITDMLS